MMLSSSWTNSHVIRPDGNASPVGVLLRGPRKTLTSSPCRRGRRARWTAVRVKPYREGTPSRRQFRGNLARRCLYLAARRSCLDRWLDEPDRYPDEPEYPGEPRIHPETQWALFNRYCDESSAWTNPALADAPGADPDRPPPPAPVTPLEALTLARLMSESFRKSYIWLI